MSLEAGVLNVGVGDSVRALRSFWFGPVSGKRFTVKAGTRGEVRAVSQSVSPTADVLFEGTDEYVRLDLAGDAVIIEACHGLTREQDGA